MRGDQQYPTLRHWHADPGQRVAIIGFGELGHVGVQIATSTTVINKMEQQMDDALQMGAAGFRESQPT